MTFPAGVNYYILIDPESSEGGAINFTLNCAAAAPCPDFSIAATSGTITHSSTTAGAGNDCSYRSSTDRASAISIPCSGTWRFSLCRGVSWDTYLYLSTSCCGGTTLSTSDDACGLQSEITAAFTPGTYFLVVEGYSSGSAGAYTLPINEVTPPTMTCPGTQTLPLGASCTANLPDYRSLVSRSDNCTPTGSPVITQTPAPGTLVFGVGTTIVSMYATDLAGNISTTCNFNVSRIDNTRPTFTTCPPNQTYFTDSGVCTHTVSGGLTPTATDNCSAVILSYIISGATTGTGTLASFVFTIRNHHRFMDRYRCFGEYNPDPLFLHGDGQ